MKIAVDLMGVIMHLSPIVEGVNQALLTFRCEGSTLERKQAISKQRQNASHYLTDRKVVCTMMSLQKLSVRKMPVLAASSQGRANAVLSAEDTGALLAAEIMY